MAAAFPLVRRSVVLLLAVIGLTFAARAGGGDDQVERGIIYGEAGGEQLLADVYRPADASFEGKRPVVLLVHGGGWCQGSRKAQSMETVARALTDAGMVAVSIDYRLVKDAPDGSTIVNQWPAAIDDCRRAVQWIRQHADEYGINPARIGAWGPSAGGHLVSLLGTTDVARSGEPSTRVQAVVDLFGPVDLTRPFPQKALVPYSVQEMVDRFVGKDDVERQRGASPVFHIDDATAPFLIFHGTHDTLVPVEQSRQLDEALKRAGRISELVIFEGEGHGFRPDLQKQMLEQTVAFFQKHLTSR